MSHTLNVYAERYWGDVKMYFFIKTILRLFEMSTKKAITKAFKCIIYLKKKKKSHIQTLKIKWGRIHMDNLLNQQLVVVLLSDSGCSSNTHFYQRKGINHFNSIYHKALVYVMINCSDL